MTDHTRICDPDDRHRRRAPAGTGPTGDDLGDTDVVAGDPPVPLTVWRVHPGHSDPAAVDTVVAARLAVRLLTAYTRPADTVVDATAGHALAAAAGRCGRRHRPATFTRSGAVAVPATVMTAAALMSTADTTADTAADTPADTGDIPGDRPPVRVRGRRTPADLDGAVGLVVAGWPLHPTMARHEDRLAGLLAAAGRLLRGDGCLALVVPSPAGTTARPEDFGPVVAAARESGLGYLQHIVAVHATVDGDRFTYHASPAERRALAAGRPAHVRVHADVFVFAHTGGRDG